MICDSYFSLTFEYEILMLEAIIISKWTNFLNLENLYRRINKKMNTIYTKKMNEISRKFFKKGRENLNFSKLHRGKVSPDTVQVII